MDDPHLYEALRYVLLNPARAGLAVSAGGWPWSIARVYLSGVRDWLTNLWRMLGGIGDIRSYLAARPDAVRVERLPVAERFGRPAAEAVFLRRLEEESGWRLRPQRCGTRVRWPAARYGGATTVTDGVEAVQ